ncbi:hypothetical protein [Actinomadura rudentiformis]|uniref:Uncharacterized protein n=1 Tax=Actinomadura rudentiformis TaxID=359158 RepID=A0A6H9YWI5_9ACTN|nr:hypothetical protein [Actinomadura rudentiformis]KAB2350347.1 hypothetical protein F8566_11275 [Actinomadura rudentiformis]
MSWDVLVLKAPGEVVGVDELPKDFDPGPIGSLRDVLDRLRRHVPLIDLSDPTWGRMESENWSIEVNIGSDDPVESVMLHVRGGGDDVVPIVVETARILGCRALDVSSGEFLSDGDTAGWRAFQEYRDRVIDHRRGI